MTADIAITGAPELADDELADNELPEPERRRRRKALFLFLLLAGLLILIATMIWYFLFRQPLPYLPPIPPTAIPAYSTSIYGADTPVGIAVTPSGDRIYVAETGGEFAVRVFDATGAEVGELKPPADTGAEHVPVWIAVDPTNGDVYVTDRPTGSVYVYSGAGEYLREFRPPDAASGWQPLAIAFDAAGGIFVTDLAEAAQVVKQYDRDGGLVQTFGAEDGLSFPNGLTVGKDGRLYVTDSNNGRLLVYAPTGELVATVGRGAGKGNLGLPRGLASDGLGRVFVVDSSGNGVNVYALLGEDELQPEHRGFFGGQGADDGKFSFPMGIAVDDRGRVYVTDTANDRIQVWNY